MSLHTYSNNCWKACQSLGQVLPLSKILSGMTRTSQDLDLDKRSERMVRQLSIGLIFEIQPIKPIKPRDENTDEEAAYLEIEVVYKKVTQEV